MSLSPAQLSTLKAAIAADPTLSSLPNDPDGNQAVADAFNAPATPDYFVWRSNVPPSEYRGANGIVWTEVDALTVGKGRIFEWLTGMLSMGINAADANVRAGLQNAFGNTSATLANLTAMGRRKASRAEKLFATGTGSTASPATMGFEGKITAADVLNAFNSQ